MKPNAFRVIGVSHSTGTFFYHPLASSMSQSSMILVLIFTLECASWTPSSHKDKIIAIQEVLFQKYKQENEEL